MRKSSLRSQERFFAGRGCPERGGGKLCLPPDVRACAHARAEGGERARTSFARAEPQAQPAARASVRLATLDEQVSPVYSGETFLGPEGPRIVIDFSEIYVSGSVTILAADAARIDLLEASEGLQEDFREFIFSQRDQKISLRVFSRGSLLREGTALSELKRDLPALHSPSGDIKSPEGGCKGGKFNFIIGFTSFRVALWRLKVVRATFSRQRQTASGVNGGFLNFINFYKNFRRCFYLPCSLPFTTEDCHRQSSVAKGRLQRG